MVNKIKKQIPNMITLSRIVACIMAAINVVIGNYPLAIILYVYGAVSDALDGLAARKLQAFTDFGRVIDPIADKIFALSLLIPSIVMGNILMLIPLSFEAVITSINVKSEKKHGKTKTERVGKFKTVSLFITMILGMISTIINEIYFIFLPFLAYTTHLQIQSINAYHNQKIRLDNEEETKTFNKNIDNQEKSLTLREKLESLKQELIYYTYVDIKKDNTKRKVKTK